MVCFLTSLREVAPELDAPALDALMVGVETLGQAPVALAHLEFHIDFSDWRVLNLLQVREAAVLVGVLLDAEQALASFRRALYRLAAATKAIRSAAGDMRQYPSRAVRSLGRDALQISAAGAIGSYAQLHQIDHHLVAVRAAAAQPEQGAGGILAEMEKALLFLRRANRRLDEGLESLGAVAARFQDLRGQGSLGHALTRPSPAIAANSRSFGSSLRRFVRIVRESNAGSYVELLQLVAGRRQGLRATTGMRFEFDFGRFSGPLEVRSGRDLAQVSELSRPHANESGIPSRRVVVVIGGIDSLLEANAMRLEIDAGVHERGWLVHGLSSLSTAQAIHGRLDLLGASLARLLKPDVMEDGVVHGPAFFLDAEHIAGEIKRMLAEDATVPIPEVWLLAHNVLNLVTASRAPEDVKNPLRNAVHILCREFDLARGVPVVFMT
ncbi:hypothetical protein ACQ4PT_017967 [Festuca glaucescens]